MDNVKTGKADVKHDAAAHTPGVHQGNQPGAVNRLGHEFRCTK